MSTDESVIDTFDVADLGLDDMVREETAFPPYWMPEWDEKKRKGNGFKATVLAMDERNPEFVRYLLEASIPLVCQRGSKLGGREIIRIEKGQTFTVSNYATLPLDGYFGLEVAVLVLNMRTLPGNEKSDGVPRDLYDFGVYVSKADRKLLDSERAKDVGTMKQLRAAARQRAEDAIKALAEKARQERALKEGGY